MTESTRLFRSTAVAGTLLCTALWVAAVHAQAAPAGQAPPAAQAPRPLPAPRYQSPGVPAATVSAPTPQYQLPVTQAVTPNGTVVEDIIVRVNDNIISRSDVERAQAQLLNEIAQSHAPDGDERMKNLLRDLIDQQLLLSKGAELSINADTELVRRLDEIRKQNNLATMEDLEKAAASQGVNFEDFKSSIRNSIITGSVVRDEVGRNIKMTHAEEQKFYGDHKEDFAQPEQVRLSEILVPTAANADDAQIAAAKKTADEIHAQLVAGADFAATAKKESGGPTAAQGGDLGAFKRGSLAPVLEEKTFVLPAGGYTDPIRTRQGYVILKATEHQQAGTPPLDQIEGEVQNAMYQAQIQPALRAYLTRLREESYVDIRPGFVDSGASSKQTKPVFAAYVAPVPKKKPQVAKQRMDAAVAARRMAQANTKSAAVVPANQPLGKNGKPKKVKREKIRYGQAPRTALPEGLETEATTGTVTGATASAPGTALAPVDTNNTVAANTPDEGDVLAPKSGPRPKTRFASREVEVNQKKVEVKQAKVVEKIKATPEAAGTEEKQAQTVQAQALGLNGSNAKKKKVKRKKGDPKDRLQEKPIEKAAPLQDNGLPDHLHQQNAPTRPDGTKVTSDSTTLAPPTQPAPGSTIPGQTPPTNGAAAPTSNQPVGQTPNSPQ